MQPAQALKHAWEADSFFKLSFYLTIPFPPPAEIIENRHGFPANGTN